MNTSIDEPVIVEKEIVNSKVSEPSWYHHVSWGAILAGVVVALLTQFALETLGIAIGVGATEVGKDMLDTGFVSATAVWLAASALLSLFAGGLVTGKLSGAIDPMDGALEGIVVMGIVTFISFFLLTTTLSATLRGVSNTITDGLSFIGASAEDISTTVAQAVELRDGTLEEIRAEAEDILADDASLTSLRVAVDDYLFADEPGNDLRQATIDALVTQTELTEDQAVEQLNEWEQEFNQVVSRVETEAEQVANDIADIVAATAGIIFMILVAGTFAAASGGFVAVSSAQSDVRAVQRETIRHQTAEVVS